MGASDFFYYVVAIGFIAAVVVWIFLAVQAIRTLQDARKILKDVGSTTGDINAFKDLIKFGISSLSGLVTAKARTFGRKRSK